MPEGEGPRPINSDILGPNPMTHTEDGRLRRRSDPHGLEFKEQAWTYFDRAALRLDEMVGFIGGRKKNNGEESDSHIKSPEHEIENIGVSPEDPFRYGSDMSPLVIKSLRALNRIGAFIEKLFARPTFDAHPTSQTSASAPTTEAPPRAGSVRVIPKKQNPPYDWNDPKQGAPEFQDNPVIDTTESTPDSTSSK